MFLNLCFWTYASTEYINSCVYALIQLSCYPPKTVICTVNQQILAAIKFGVSQNKVIWR